MLTKNIRFIYRQLIGILLLVAVGYSPSVHANTLYQINGTTFPAYTRITLNWDAISPFKHFMLSNPLRLVVDCTASHLDKALKIVKEDGVPNATVQDIRASQFNANTVRVVITLNTPVETKIFTLPAMSPQDKQQLAIDLYPNQKKSPAEATKPTLKAPIKPTPPSTKIVTKSIENRTSHPPFVVMIDPGHGGKDPGAIGPSKAREKDVALAISQKLKKLLSLNPRIKVYLTREEDIFIPLGTRVAKARERHADLFVSIHADGSPTPNAHGSSVFALSEKGATSLVARLLAQSENSVDQIAGITTYDTSWHVRHTLLDLTQAAAINSSLKLGKLILDKIGELKTLHRDYVEQANFYVLKAPGVPSVLVETAFISNPDEERELTNNDFQLKIAKAIMAGIEAYMSSVHKGLHFKIKAT